MRLRRFLQSAPLTAASRICYYYCEKSMCVCVLCMMFSVKEMYSKEKKNEVKWNVKWCVVSRSHFKQMSILAITHIFSYFSFVTTAARRQSVLTIVKWCYVFFMLYIFHVSDSLISVTHSQRTHKVCRNRISFSILYKAFLSTTSPLLSSECRKKVCIVN